MNITIIGAGIGGLSAACLLAKQGHHVVVVEKNQNYGGKLNETKAQGYRFDTGPSLFTMPYILDDLLKMCGTSLEERLELVPMDINCRYFYPDGTQFDNFVELESTLQEINRFAPEDSEAFSEFLDYARSLDQKTREAFVRNPLYDFSDLKNLKLFSFFGIDAFTTVSNRVDSVFKSTYLRQFFKRFTTYNGSSPYQAPATLNVIPHIELNEGGYYIKGGLYRIGECLFNLATELGVEFKFNTSIKHIDVKNGVTKGVIDQNGTYFPSDLVVANSDASETLLKLIDDESYPKPKKVKTKAIEPSCSGFVMLLGVNKVYDSLIHHNIYFSDDYKGEFEAIFKDKVMPDDPTIYIANTSYSDKDHAPSSSSNLFILVNAPYLSDQYNWEQEAENYAQHVIQILENKGLSKLAESIEYQEIINPKDFYEKYRSNKGSIYGTSSNNKFSAFIRPRNKSREIQGLYFVGGSTHPGGGIPLVVQSAINAVELIKRYETGR